MVDGISNIVNTGTDPVNTGTGKSVLGKDDFMKLMIAQMKYQDPLNPMDSDQYAAQLAQFGSLEQLQNMNKSLETSINANFQLAQSVNNTMSTSFIGKEVKLTGESVNYTGQQKVDFEYVLGGDSKQVTVNIKNQYGNIVKSIEPSGFNSGSHRVTWDFTDALGKTVEQGDYTVEVNAMALNGSELHTEVYKVGTVDALRFTQDGSVVIVGDHQYPLADVYEIINKTVPE